MLTTHSQNGDEGGERGGRLHRKQMHRVKMSSVFNSLGAGRGRGRTFTPKGS